MLESSNISICRRYLTIPVVEISKCLLAIIISLILTACGGGGGSSSGASDDTQGSNPFAGTYSGTERLAGGTFPITIVIRNNGRITITDVDNISASGRLNGNQFRIVRNSPRQIFEGEINGNIITGVTTENVAFGDGTFRAVKQN